MASQHSIKSTRLDELLTVLADQYCRSIIFYFQNTSEEVATIADLTSEIETQDGKEETVVQLHHIMLPRLEDAGIIEYDARNRTVRYQSQLDLQPLIEDIEVLDQTLGTGSDSLESV